MEEKHDIVASVFKAKGKPVSKTKISPRPVVKMKAGNIQLTIFKGTNPILAAEVVVNTDLKLSEITGLKMYFFTGLNAALHVVPCNLSYDMICQKF